MTAHDQSPTPRESGGTAADGPEQGCTCELSDDESVSFVEYAIGRTESEKILAEDRSQCPVHGDDDSSPRRPVELTTAR